MRLPKSKAVYAAVGAVIAFLGTGAATYDSVFKTVTVQDNGQRKTLRGFSTGTVRQFLEEHNVHVMKRDRVSPDLDSPVQNDMTVKIVHPKEVTIDLKGKVGQISTFDTSVGQLLKDQHISLSSSDQLNVPTDANLTDGETISIHSLSEKVSTETQSIPFQTIRRRTGSLTNGNQRVVTHGVKGVLQVKTTSVYRDGHKISQTVDKKVVQKPVSAVVEIGTATAVHQYALASRGDSPGSGLITHQITVLATAYTAGGLTASGRPAQPGVIAVDPSVIPLGTHVYVPGVGDVVAADTGGAIVGRHIDICMPTRAQAEEWGARTITIDILQ